MLYRKTDVTHEDQYTHHGKHNLLNFCGSLEGKSEKITPGDVTSYYWTCNLFMESMYYKLRMWSLKDVGIYQAGEDLTKDAIELYYGK